MTQYRGIKIQINDPYTNMTKFRFLNLASIAACFCLPVWPPHLISRKHVLLLSASLPCFCICKQMLFTLFRSPPQLANTFDNSTRIIPLWSLSWSPPLPTEATIHHLPIYKLYGRSLPNDVTLHYSSWCCGDHDRALTMLLHYCNLLWTVM